MRTESPSLSQLHQDVIANMLHFAHNIWDLLHLEATSANFHGLVKQHMRTMKYVDLRVPYHEDKGRRLADKYASEIEYFRVLGVRSGMIKMLKFRFGDQLEEVKMLNDDSISNGILRHSEYTTFLIWKHAQLGLLEQNDSTSWLRVCRVARMLVLIDDGQSRKTNTIKIRSDSLEDLLQELLVFRDHKLDLSKYTVLNLELEDGASERLVVLLWHFFPNLKSIICSRVSGEFSVDFLLLLTQAWERKTGKRIIIELKYNDYVNITFDQSLVDRGEAYINELNNCLTEFVPFKFSPVTMKQQGRKEYLLARDILKKHYSDDQVEEYMKALFKVKHCSLIYIVANVIDCILYHAEETEKIEIDVKSCFPNEISQVAAFGCIAVACLNLKHLSVHGDAKLSLECENLIATRGKNLEAIEIKMHNIRAGLLMTIVDHCPKLKRLKIVGREGDEIADLQDTLLDKFRRMRKLEEVNIVYKTKDDGQTVKLVYLNDKMAFLPPRSQPDVVDSGGDSDLEIPVNVLPAIANEENQNGANNAQPAVVAVVQPVRAISRISIMLSYLIGAKKRVDKVFNKLYRPQSVTFFITFYFVIYLATGIMKTFTEVMIKKTPVEYKALYNERLSTGRTICEISRWSLLIALQFYKYYWL
ncbi:hypothetical protein HDE_12828 [Halotydeus destructor]|nr:hypothetical protein HDE_12828 [Halotydeus destructor]